MIPASSIVQEARRWIGTPYRHQGRSENGLDCVGLILWVCAKQGILPREADRNDYGRLPGAELQDRIARYCMAADTAEPGGLVVIRWPRDRHPSHVAFCAGDTLIHCYSMAGKVVEHGYRAPWPRLTASLWRLPGVWYP